jgi:hypothetical protein
MILAGSGTSARSPRASCSSRSDAEAERLKEIGAALDPKEAAEQTRRQAADEAEALRAQAAALEAQADAAENPPGAENLSSMSKTDLQARADAEGLEVEGTGKDGAVTKADLESALSQHDAAQG